MGIVKTENQEFPAVSGENLSRAIDVISSIGLSKEEGNIRLRQIENVDVSGSKGTEHTD